MELNTSSAHTDILQFVAENDVKFIRLAFCDLFGMQKNISILADEMETAFADGVSFDASAIAGFCGVADSDLLLKPDPSTILLLPWRPQQGRVARFYCSIYRPDGHPFAYDTRAMLRRAVDDCRKAGYECRIGAESEFYLFKTDEDGEPTRQPFDKGGYFDMAPLDKGENIRREICLTLEEMGLHPESSHHEQGPGQNEIDFRFADALSSADDFLTFKTAVKAIATRNGLFASFLPKPLMGKSGSGLHINLSLHRGGENIFQEGSRYSAERNSFLAGILAKAREISLFLNPITNSYERLGELEAPGYASWSKGNRSQLIRIPAASPLRSRMELRSPDGALNPYLAYTLIIKAGLWGMEQELPLPKSTDFNLYEASDSLKSQLPSLPRTLKEALEEAERSDFVRQTLGRELVQKYADQKRKELDHPADPFPLI